MLGLRRQLSILLPPLREEHTACLGHAVVASRMRAAAWRRCSLSALRAEAVPDAPAAGRRLLQLQPACRRGMMRLCLPCRCVAIRLHWAGAWAACYSTLPYVGFCQWAAPCSRALQISKQFV
jgi:hypothetical protein